MAASGRRSGRDAEAVPRRSSGSGRSNLVRSGRPVPEVAEPAGDRRVVPVPVEEGQDLLNRQRWRTRVELANATFEYIEGFRNRRRRHSALGWARPLEFETEHRHQATTPNGAFR